MPSRRTTKTPAKLKTKVWLDPEITFSKSGKAELLKPELKETPARDDAKQPATLIETAVEGILKDFGFLETLPALAALSKDEKSTGYLKALTALQPGQYDRAFKTARELIGPRYAKIDGKPRHDPFYDLQFYDLLDQYKRRVHELLNPDLSGAPAQTSATVEPAETQTHEQEMVEGDSIVFKNGTLFKAGVPYRPLAAAAPLAQTHRTTLLNWIKNKTEFAGRPLQSYHFPPANRYFVSEESISRAANRFIKWPSQEPAGPVTIGETKDKNGYIGISKAARTLGVDHHTMWLWTTHGTAPTDKPLDVIKDPASEQLYIREREITRLKKLIPRSGLKRGRRSGTPQP